MKMMCKVYDFEAGLLKAEVRKITKGDFLQDMEDYLGKNVGLSTKVDSIVFAVVSVLCEIFFLS